MPQLSIPVIACGGRLTIGGARLSDRTSGSAKRRGGDVTVKNKNDLIDLKRSSTVHSTSPVVICTSGG